MILADHRRALRYDEWANRAVVAALVAGGEWPPASQRWLAHIVGTEWRWLARLRGEEPRMAVWPDLGPSEIARELDELARAWARYLDEMPAHGWSDHIAYVNSRGESWQSTANDVLAHVVIHSAHHRGQIAADMRAAGLEPPYTDFINAARQGLI